jgi:capsular polysaccharide biosynthesis protein
MELRRYLRLIRQRLLLVVIAIIAGAAVGYVATSRTPSYTATASIYVGVTDLGPQDEYLYQEADLNEIVSTYATMIPAPVIAQKALNNTHINRFAGEVAAATTATVVLGTQLIDVTVTDPSSAVAIRLANGVSRAFVEQVSNYQSNSGAAQGALPNEPAHVYQEATSAVASSSGLTKRMILGAVFGLIVSIFVILLLDYLDITIKSPDDLERRVGLPVLGIIPRFDTLRLDSSPAGSLQRPVPRGNRG